MVYKRLLGFRLGHHQDRTENVTRFFLLSLSLSESSVFQVCTDKFTAYGINLSRVQKLVRDNSSKWICHISYICHIFNNYIEKSI